MQIGAAPPHQFAFAGELYVSQNTNTNTIGARSLIIRQTSHMKLRRAFAATLFVITGCAQDPPTQAPLPAPSMSQRNQSPSELNYAQRIRAAILPYVVLVDPIEGNPAAEVKVTTRSNGEIVDAELIRSSGYPSWDKSVRTAVLKAGRIPRDGNGRVPPVLFITFYPKP